VANLRLDPDEINAQRFGVPRIRLHTCSSHNLPLQRFHGLAKQRSHSISGLEACPGNKLIQYGPSWLGMATLGPHSLLVLPAHQKDLKLIEQEHAIHYW
jgi:hypothetical protein